MNALDYQAARGESQMTFGRGAARDTACTLIDSLILFQK